MPSQSAISKERLVANACISLSILVFSACLGACITFYFVDLATSEHYNTWLNHRFSKPVQYLIEMFHAHQLGIDSCGQIAELYELHKDDSWYTGPLSWCISFKNGSIFDDQLFVEYLEELDYTHYQITFCVTQLCAISIAYLVVESLMWYFGTEYGTRSIFSVAACSIKGLCQSVGALEVIVVSCAVVTSFPIILLFAFISQPTFTDYCDLFYYDTLKSAYVFKLVFTMLRSAGSVYLNPILIHAAMVWIPVFAIIALVLTFHRSHQRELDHDKTE